MKQKLISSSCFLMACLCLMFYLNSCKSSQGRQRSGDGDENSNIWKYQDVVRFKIFQPEYSAIKEKEGWQDFIIKDGNPPANDQAKGWFIRQGKIEEEKTAKRNFYVDFIAVKKGENEALSRSPIKKGDSFYLKTNTHCVDTGYCFLQRAHWKYLFTEDTSIKFITTEKNHAIENKNSNKLEFSDKTSPDRLEFFIEEDSIEFGKTFRLYTELDEVKYFLASYSGEDHDPTVPFTNTHYHKRIALVRADIYKTTEAKWEKIKKEFTSKFRSPQKKDEKLSDNIKVEKCDKTCQDKNNQPHGELSTKEALCSTNDTTLLDKPGTSFCYHGINRIEGFYQAALTTQSMTNVTGGAAAMLFTLFGHPEIAAAIGVGATLIKETTKANEPTRKALRFSYDACHEICYEKWDKAKIEPFYTKMAELYDKTSEDKNALQKSTTLKEVLQD